MLLKAILKIIFYCANTWLFGYAVGKFASDIDIRVVALIVSIVGIWWGLYSFRLVKRRNPTLGALTYSLSIALIVILVTFGFYVGAK